MNLRQKLITGITGLALTCSAVAIAQGRPEDNVGRHHPNLQAAQRLSTQAYEKLKAAQRSNEYDLEGHAQKAEALLDQANREIAAAANASNHEKREKH